MGRSLVFTTVSTMVITISDLKTRISSIKGRCLAHSIRFAGLFLIAGLLGCAAAAPAQSATSGRYEQLSLAVGQDGSITGSYGEEQGQGVVKTCTFAISGRLDRNGRGAISAWAETAGPVLRGQIATRVNQVVLKVPGADDFPGCGLVISPEIATGLQFSKTVNTSWTAMRIIRVSKARFYAKPGHTASRRYVVAEDVVGVRGQRGARLAVDYVSLAGRVSSGWIATAETGPLTPPR